MQVGAFVLVLSYAGGVIVRTHVRCYQEDCFLSSVLPDPEQALSFVKDLLALCITLFDKRLFRESWLVFDLVAQVQLIKVDGLPGLARLVPITLPAASVPHTHTRHRS